jgi:hypothetical protein
VILPVAVSAEWGIGGAAFYKSPVLLGQPIDVANLNVNHFSFGGDVLLKVGWFQAEGLVLYSTGDINSLNISLDAGPNFTNNFGQRLVVQAGLNAKIGAEVKLGPISLGLSYIMALDITNGIDITTSSGLVGAQILFWL